MNDFFKRWFSHSKEENNIDDNQNPWAGLASYEDPESAKRKLKFCGRDDDSYDLARLVMGNVFVTLYGRSGIGKTSLLNAGVFPELREEQYTPVTIRLGIRNEEDPDSYQTMIVEAVERVTKRHSTVNVVDEQKDQQSTDYLWNYFARHRFFDKDDEPTTPVIVFDQFEEVFRGYRDEAETLLRQLDYLNDKDHTLDSCEVDGLPYRYEQNFRFVVSIREDDLYRLEDSIDNCYLPALKRCRYRLRSLSDEGARDVILIPGEGLFKTEERDGIVNTIIGIARNKDGHSISTNLLSLVCSRIFADFQKSKADHITTSIVDSFVEGNPIEQFYNETISILSLKTREKLERELVTADGHRKYMDEKTFNSYIKEEGVRKKFLEGSHKIFQHTSISSDNSATGIELIHDSFCDAIISLRQKRQRRLHYFAAVFITVLILIIVGESLYVMFLRKKPERQWTVRLEEVNNQDEKRWTAYVTIKSLYNDSILIQDTISLFRKDIKFVDYDVKTPADITACKIHIEIKDTAFCPVKDSIVKFQDPSTPIIVFPVKRVVKDKYTLPVYAYIDDGKKNKNPKPLQNTFITFNTQSFVSYAQDYTDKDGICTFTGLLIKPDTACYITAMHDGFMLKTEKINQEGETIKVGLRPIPFMIKDMANQIKDRLMEVRSRSESQEKKLNYTQTLKIHYDNGKADDIIYLGAYEDSIYNNTLGIVKGVYYYHKDHSRKFDWENVPTGKLYLFDGYTDAGQTKNRKVFSFFTGTDSLYNKQYFSGMIKGNVGWQGRFTTPNKVGLNGTY